MIKKTLIWDLPTRLFHWSLVLLVSFSIYTGLTGGVAEMEYHMLSGYCILVLLLFRLGWGFLGSYHSRFINFVSVRGLTSYVGNILNRGGETKGHNPLGAWSVIAMLTVILVQAITGLFSDDDIMTKGPLTHLVPDNFVNELTGLHRLNSWLVYGLIGLHLIAIAFYEIYRRERLIVPMITGRKQVLNEREENGAHTEKYSAIRASLLILACTGIVYYLVNEA